MRVLILIFSMQLLCSCVGIEKYAGGYLGTAINHDTNANADVGARVGLWKHLGETNWRGGAAIDLSGYWSELSDDSVLKGKSTANVSTVPISTLFMLGYQYDPILVYAGAGPSILVTAGDANGVDFGPDIRLGTAFELHDKWNLFGEWRLTYNPQEYEWSETGELPLAGYRRPREPSPFIVSEDLSDKIGWTSHILFGVSRSF